MYIKVINTLDRNNTVFLISILYATAAQANGYEAPATTLEVLAETNTPPPARTDPECAPHSGREPDPKSVLAGARAVRHTPAPDPQRPRSPRP